MLWIIIALAVSYLIGSIPTAYIFGRLVKGVDIRKHGSGNVGATNAFRVLGRPYGITVLLLDAFKAFAITVFWADFLAGRINLPVETLRIILGLVCIAGHNWTVFLQFKGGKGMASTLGMLLGLALKVAGLGKILGLVILCWVIVFFVSRIVSLASLASAICLPLLAFAFRQSGQILLLSLALSGLVILRHRANILRLLQGKEKRLF